MAEDHEWIKAPIDPGKDALWSAFLARLHRLGIDREEYEAFTHSYEVPDAVLKEADDIGEFEKVVLLAEWHERFLGKGETLKGGPPKISLTTRFQITDRIDKGEGHRKALEFILASDALARAYYEAVEGE